MSSRGKRSSILKKRPSMGAGGSLESSPTETIGTGRATKKIGFKPKKSVKEFFASDETATIWCNSYELSTEGTPLHLTVSDTTIKDDGSRESRMDKENVEDSRRNSINNSAWNLSVSVSEEEKRRMKSEISMNSSVLNVTDRLTLEPTALNVPPRPVLGQKQIDLGTDSSAMDVSPAKVSDGRHNSPRKTIYFHPKQNMFITIDDVVSNDQKVATTPEHQHSSPNDTDINFFGPPRQSSQLPPPEAAPVKILFQTSSSNATTLANPWRNKSVTTSDISAGWSSHVGIDHSANQPRYTSYNSQFEISEAWNSHPAAALKLRMLQQGLEPPPDFDDPRLSGGGGCGSGRTSDVDTTLAITQTVAKMLRPSISGSRTVSLDSTRVGEDDDDVEIVEIEPEAMDRTSGKHISHQVDVPMQTDDDSPALEASVSDVLLPPNALSRARPSFIPSETVPMDESYCPSPEPAGKIEASDSKRITFAQPVPMDVPEVQSLSRKTILNEEKMALDVPTSRLNSVRHTVFGAQMALAEKEQDRKLTALPQIEPIKIDLADLVFARNSIGLDLVPAEKTPVEINRPKIHRIAPRALGFNFCEATPSTSGNIKPVELPKQPPRVTIYSADVVEQTRVENPEVREPRKTIVQSLDVSMASPVEETSVPKSRGTVFDSEDVNESVAEPATKQNHLRPTMLFNEKLEVSKLEPRSGSLEDLRRYGQSRKTIISSGDDDVIVLDSPDMTGRKSLTANHRGTLLVNGDMDRTRRTPSPVQQLEQQNVSRPRQTTVGADSMEQTIEVNSSISPVTGPCRFTVYDGDRMEESRIQDLISPEVFGQPAATKLRQTCYQAEIDETVPIRGSVVPVQNPSRKSVLQEVNMDETRGVSATQQLEQTKSNRTLQQKSRQTSFALQDMNVTRAGGQHSEIDETARGGNKTLQTSRQTSYATQDMNRTVSPVNQNGHVVMDETCRQDRLEQSQSSKTLLKSRQTTVVLQNMNETRPDGQQIDETVGMSSRTHSKLRQTSFAVQDMNETRAGGQQSEIDQSARTANRTLQKSRQTSFAAHDMNRTVSPVNQNAHQTVSEQVEMEETCQQDRLQQSMPFRTHVKTRQTTVALQDMNETRASDQQVVMDDTVRMASRTHSKLRQTTVALQNMNETRAGGQQSEIDDTDRTGDRTLQKSRQTSFAVQDMNETRAGGQQSEIYQSARTANRTLQKSRQTSFATQDMNRTVSPVNQNAHQNVSERVDMEETCRQDPLEQSKPSRTIIKSRQTNFALQDMNETRAGSLVDQQVVRDEAAKISNRTQDTLTKSRQTSFAVQDMNETRAGGQQVENDEMARTLQKSRQTSFAVQDMNETRAGGLQSKIDQSSRTNNKTLHKSRQTSFANQDMNRTISPVNQNAHQSVSEHVEMDETCQQDRQEQSRPSITLLKYRHTNVALQDMNETKAGSPVEQQLTMNETARTSNRTLQKSRQTSCAVQNMNESGDCGHILIQQVDKSSRTLEKSRQTTIAPVEMNRTVSPAVPQHVEMGESLQATKVLQKSRQTSFAIEDMNETRARCSQIKAGQVEMDETVRTSNRTLQKSRQTSFAVQDMNETGRVSPKLRQSEVEMDEASPVRAWQLSRSQFATSRSIADPREQSKVLQKSRQTSFAAEKMDETLAGLTKPAGFENLQKSSRQTVFQEVEMDQTRREVVNQLQVNDQNARLSRLEQSRASRIPRQTSFVVEDMNETGAQRNDPDEIMAKSGRLCKFSLRDESQKTRQTSFATKNMDETSVETTRLQRTTQNVSQSNLQKSRQTTFQHAEMDQTCCQSPLHIEETILQSPQRRDHQASQAPSLFQSTNHSTVVERPRQTICNDVPMDDIDETVPIGQHQPVVEARSSFSSPHYNLEQSIKQHSIATATNSRPRHTIYAQESMEETMTGMPRISDGYRLVVEGEQKKTPPPAVVERVMETAKSRKTVYCEDDMEQTTVGFRLRKVAEVEPPLMNEQNPVKERAPSPKIFNHGSLQPTRHRQTILAPQDMEQSLMQQSMEVSVIKPTPRAEVFQSRHQAHSTNLHQKKPLKQEQIDSPCSSEKDYDESSTVEMKQEQSDFSFTMPALPEDRVLRCSAVIPTYRMAPVGRVGPTKSLVPEEDLMVPPGGRMFSGVVRVPMDELSEISGLADTSRLYRPALPVSIMAGDVSSFALLKEVTEPSILQPVDVVPPSVPTPVIQETPRKTSMIPVVRRSRGSIFNRQSVDMDMSGVTAMDGGTPQSDEKVAARKEKEPEAHIESEPTNLNASEEDEFYDAETNPVLEEHGDPLVPAPAISEQSTMMHLDANQTAAGLKTLKFIDVDELEQTTGWPQKQQQQHQKRHLSQISKSVLLEEQEEGDPLNVSLSDDYPLKKRKTVAVPTPVKDPAEEDKPSRKTLRRVTFQPVLELETVTIKKECETIVEADETGVSGAAAEESRFDPSVFIVEESDMLANESNISLVASPTAHESSSSRTTRASSSKYDNSIYREYGNLTLNVDQLGSNSCIIISDDSLTVPSSTTVPEPAPAQLRLTLADLPKRIRKSRESLVLNSTVASEIMYEINHEVTAAKRTCCSFQGSCNCQRPRRTVAAVRLETVETVRESWETNFGRILESVADVTTARERDLPLDERIREIAGRPLKVALPLPQCLERGRAEGQLPEVPSIWFLTENFLRSTLSDNDSSSSEVFAPCNLPATPCSTALVRNRLETQGFRWFLDSSCEASERRLYLRHRTLRTLKLVIFLPKSPLDHPEEHVRIERLELVECWRQAVPSTRLLAAHAEFMEIGPKNVRDVLSSMCTSTGHLMSLVVHLDSLVEQVLGKVDALWQIVKNNGAVLEEFGTDRRLRISKYFEYQHEQTVHWNRLEVQFDAIDRIERSSVSFHRSDQKHCESLFPTEQQCGKSGLQGLVFLECLLWNVEKLALEC